LQKFPIETLKKWFIQNRRSLPWRCHPTPYHVWISEVMLQQTQVSVVIPYYMRWFKRFPTIEALAQAPLELVLKCWEGLGYYSRARNLHTAARYIVKYFGGKFPDSEEQLATIKGIGPYTQGAILSFAFKRKAAAIDGNVVRLLSRYLAYEHNVDTQLARTQFKQYVESILPDEEPWLVSEGLIELGATICAKKANCLLCPLRADCQAFRHSLQDKLPVKKARLAPIVLRRQVAVVQCQNHVLIKKGESGKVMADLYEFPYAEGSDHWECLHSLLGLKMRYIKSLTLQKHTFTRFRAHLFPHLFEAEVRTDSDFWKKKDELLKLPFSSGHKRILEDWLNR
jgi:A/G-specific adenine glycosylase